MYLLGTRYLIVLLVILSQKCGFAKLKNFAPEQIATAKMATKFLTPPWFNLNNSWINEVESHCRNNVVVLFEGADAEELWALRMLDASSRIPSGILTGNVYDLGMYDECVGVKRHQNPANVQGQHCMVTLSIPSKLGAATEEILRVQRVSTYNPTPGAYVSITVSVCLPSSCNVEDVADLVNASIRSQPELVALETRMVQVKCSRVEPTDDLTVGKIMAISFFATIAILLLTCTICDIVVRTGYYGKSPKLETVAKFSLYTNANKLFDVELSPETMPALNGYRFLNGFIIITGHRFLSVLFRPMVNLTAVFELRGTLRLSILHTIPYVVDTFFAMSGFLSARTFLMSLRSGKKINLFSRSLNRYIRLTPSVAVLILFQIFILPSLGSGPLWETVIDLQNGYCRKNWWTNLLYIQNLVNPQEMCLLHTWYLAADMHFFLLSPIILYTLHYRPKLGLMTLGLLSIVSMIIPAVQLAVNKWPALWNIGEKNRDEILYSFFNSHTVSYNRALPYLIGILLAYDVVNNKRQISKVQATINWLLAGILFTFSVNLIYFVYPNVSTYNVISEVAFVSVGRLTWSLASAWILYACTQGYGGPVTRFLSKPIFTPLSRLSYCIYLTSYIVQMGFNAAERTAEYFAPHKTMNQMWGDLAISIMVAFVWNVCFEVPVIEMDNIFRARRRTAITEHASMKKGEKASPLMTKHLDSTRSQVSSDSSVTTRKRNSWTFNNLGNKLSRAKTLPVAVNSDSEGSEDFEKSEIVQSTIPQMVSRSLQDEELVQSSASSLTRRK